MRKRKGVSESNTQSYQFILVTDAGEFIPPESNTINWYDSVITALDPSWLLVPQIADPPLTATTTTERRTKSMNQQGRTTRRTTPSSSTTATSYPPLRSTPIVNTTPTRNPPLPLLPPRQITPPPPPPPPVILTPASTNATNSIANTPIDRDTTAIANLCDYYSSNEARNRFGYVNPKNDEQQNESVREVIIKRIKKFHIAAFTCDGWRDILDVNDEKNMYTPAHVYKLQRKCKFLYYTLNIIVLKQS